MFNLKLENIKAYSGRHWYQYIVMALLACVLLLVNNIPYNIITRMSYLSKGMIFTLVAFMIFRLHSTILFFIALWTLVITLILFVSGNQDASETWSMAVYGFFILGIFALFFDNRKDFN